MRGFLLAVLVVGMCGQAMAQSLPYGGTSPGETLNASPAALNSFSNELRAFGGRWSDGTCTARWNDLSTLGLDITFRDQSGGTDVERVVGLLPGGFLTQGIVVSRGTPGGFWRYQPLAADAIRVKNLATGTTFMLRRCSHFSSADANTAVGTPKSAGPSVASSMVQRPSFNCDRARDPLGSTICGSDYLSKLDRELSQAYYALRHQVAEDQRQLLRQQAIGFQQQVIGECGLPKTGIPSIAVQSRAVSCVGNNFRAKRQQYMEMLLGDGRVEAGRGIAEHIALQAALSAKGFLVLEEPADGVYGPATREAIVRYQVTNSLPVTGFISADSALALLSASADAAGKLVGSGSETQQFKQSTPTTAASVQQIPQPQALASVPAALERRPTAASRAIVQQGNPQDLLILANTSPDAPNAALDLSGQLVFPSGRSLLCFDPNTDHDFNELIAIGWWLGSRKLTVVGEVNECRDTIFNRLDGILISRGSIGRLEASLFNDVASRLQAGTAQVFLVVSTLDRQSARDQRELARTSSEQAVTAGRPGFGYAVLANTSATACIVADTSTEQSWRSLLQQRRMDLALDLGRFLQPQPQMTEADTAYIGGRRGNCGVIVANADQLAAMFKAFQRDQVKAKYGAVWFSPDALQSTTSRLQAGSESAAQAAEQARQSAAQERELRSRREEAEGVRREERTRQLRATFSASATALRDDVGTLVLALYKSGGNVDRQNWAGLAFAEVAGEAVRRIREGWVFSDGSTEIVEYGRSYWSGRNLETGVFRIRIKLKNPDVGRYDDLCFDVAYQNDTEFQRIRSHQSFACEVSAQTKNWLSSLKYESYWNSP